MPLHCYRTIDKSMVSSNPLAIIPHGDYNKQVTRRLDDALASGFIKQDTYVPRPLRRSAVGSAVPTRTIYGTHQRSHRLSMRVVQLYASIYLAVSQLRFVEPSPQNESEFTHYHRGKPHNLSATDSPNRSLLATN